MEQFPDGLIVAGAAISHRDRVHAAAAQHRILVGGQARHQRVALLESVEHGEGDADCQASQDFLVLRVLSVLKFKKKSRNIVADPIIFLKLEKPCILPAFHSFIHPTQHQHYLAVNALSKETLENEISCIQRSFH